MIALARNIFVLALCSVVSWSQCLARYENPRFSRDERWLAFDNCEDRCRFVVYSLDEQTASTFDKPRDEDWINPSFGPSSDILAFVTRRSRLDGQVAVVSADGTGFRILTASDTIKRSPSFSPDGKSIIFVGDEFKKAGPRGVGIQDIYLINLSTREEQRITDLRALRVSAPFFMPDGERLVFTTVGSASPRSRPPDSPIDLERYVRDSTKIKVFVVPLVGTQDVAPFVRDLNNASHPMPIQTGDVAVISRVNEIDGIKGDFLYDIFLTSPEKSRRHTQFRKYIRTYGISASGKLVAFVTTSPGRRYEENKLMLWRKSTGEAVELTIPNPRVVKIRD